MLIPVLLISSLLVISVRNPVHSVLYLILAFFNAAAIFLLSGAEFLAMMLLVVYVGAVIVLFLFVVMMLDIDFTQLKSGFVRYTPLGILVGVVMLSELIIGLISYNFSTHISHNTVEPIGDLDKISNTKMLGDVLYTSYAFYFELAGLVLLVAMISSIVLTLQHKAHVKRQNISEQVSRTKENAIEIKKVEFGKGIE